MLQTQKKVAAHIKTSNEVAFPEVSIITPIFNGGQFFPATRDSILAQTFRNFEWIIVNDKSTDGTREIIDELSSEDPRVTVIHLTENRGPIYARNTAMKAARDRFVAFLDDDDLWLPEKLERQVHFMKSTGVHLSYTAYKKITSTDTLKTGVTLHVRKKASYRNILHSNCIMASSVMFDTQKTGRILQSFNAPVGKDDCYFFLSILKKHGPGYGLNEDLARLRVHGDSLTGSKIKAAELQWHFYRDTLALSFFSSLEKFIIYAVKGLFKHLL
jgi:teichuronic acid biosynthesis glycosyltransferase TuaG